MAVCVMCPAHTDTASSTSPLIQTAPCITYPIRKNIDLPESVACPVPAGSVIFHHGCTLHHSEVNHTNTWRKALILHYATSDSRSEREQLNNEISLEID